MSTPHENHVWRLNRTPQAGLPVRADFRWVSEPVPDPGPGQILTRTLYLSLDPYQWGRRRSGTEAPGDVCHGRTVSQIMKSRHDDWPEGEFVFNTVGWQEWGLTGEGIDCFNYMYPRLLDARRAPISTALGVMGMLGLTAYAGIQVQCQPRPGETVVVSAASGGVGQCAGQIAKLLGARVVGIAGVSEKCRFVTEVLGFDACVSHQSESFAEDLAAACPDGIDVYFENVGGPVFEAVLPNFRRGARITLCGLVSQYGSAGNAHEAWGETGAATFEDRQITVHGLFVGNFVDEYQDEFLERMSEWVRTGQVKYKEDLWPGLEQAPDAFAALLKGGNFGKMLVGVGEDPSTTDGIAARRASDNVL